jgi:hypothetical protein
MHQNGKWKRKHQKKSTGTLFFIRLSSLIWIKRLFKAVHFFGKFIARSAVACDKKSVSDKSISLFQGPIPCLPWFQQFMTNRCLVVGKYEYIVLTVYTILISKGIYLLDKIEGLLFYRPIHKIILALKPFAESVTGSATDSLPNRRVL